MTGASRLAVSTSAARFPPRARPASLRHHLLVRAPARDLGRREEARRRVRLAGPLDAERLLGQGDLETDEILESFARGDACVVVEDGDLVLSSAWASTGTQELEALGVALDVPDDAFFVHGTFTHAWVRRRGLATLCYQRLFDELAARGRTTAYAALDAWNRPSRLAHQRWGFRTVGRCVTVDAGPLRLAFRPRWPARVPRLLLALPGPRARDRSGDASRA